MIDKGFNLSMPLNRRATGLRTRVISSCLLWLVSASQCPPILFAAYSRDFLITEMVSRADGILVGSITGVVQTPVAAVLTIDVDRVLKRDGSITPRIVVRYVFPLRYRGSRTVAKRRGLFFLRAAGLDKWELLPASEGPAAFEQFYYPVHTTALPSIYAYGTNTPALDKVLSELAEAAERSGGAEGFGNFGLSTIRLEDSALVTKILSRFSRSSSLDLRALGLSRLIPGEDSKALFRGSKEIGLLAKSRWNSNFISSFSAFRGTDPAAIRELGRLAQASDSSNELRRACAWSLRAIHTKETLPYLIWLLDSSDRDIRDNALYGLNAFVIGLPIERPGINMNQAMDAILNPGRHIPVSSWPASRMLGIDAGQEASRFIRFGRIADRAEEARYIEFWKMWWRRYSPRFL